ncbi:MFS transporter [Cognatishimia sp. D5M38]|uniref:MFS transporter n=1 Tax=Cognatishimia coralii TaxID=3083254 RepID=A0ABU8QBS0_9RHOB
MGQVISSTWALMLGMLLLMVGNGVQGSLLGIRGEIEGFSTVEMSFVMSAYFLGFLGGSRLAPEMIRRVGHVRVFAALGSFISAALIVFPWLTDPWVWMFCRAVIGFGFCGVYVTAESWLNNAATNENRGKTLSLYMYAQVTGIIAAQGLLVTADPSGFVLFVIPSILVSLSFAPILLSISPTPAFESTHSMKLTEIFHVSPLGVVGMFILGGIFSAQFGMSAVFGSQAGLTIPEISLFIAMFYIGSVVTQYPIGWFSDRMDRRVVIFTVSAFATAGAVVGLLFPGSYTLLLVAAFVVGGATNPLYSLLIAHANDFLSREDMASASAGLLFVNGCGAVLGPIAIGWLMTNLGTSAYFLFLGVLTGIMGLYTMYRMTKRAAPSVEETGSFAPVLPTSTSVAMEAAQEYAQYSIDEESDAQSAS